MEREHFDFYIGDLHIHGHASPEALCALSNFNVSAGEVGGATASDLAKIDEAVSEANVQLGDAQSKPST